jgi:predicted nucleic acid-binding protein
MTSWVVADAGIIIAALISDPRSTAVEIRMRDWAQQGIRLAAPELLRYEVIAVVRKHVARATITPSMAEQAIQIFLSQPVQYLIGDGLLKRGCEIASQFSLPTAYDTQYVAVAEYLKCDFWTLDGALFRALSDSLPWVKWIEGS